MSPSCKCLARSNLLQLRNVSVKGIGIAAPGSLVGELPEGVEAPARRELSDGAGVTSDDQGALAAKRSAVAGARLPPAGRGVNQGIDAGGRVVRLDKVGHPVDHGARGQAVTSGTAGVVLHVKHSRQRDAVLGPATAVRQEVLGLGGTGRGGRLSKVIATADEASLCRAGVVGAEAGVLVGDAFGSLSSVSVYREP